VASSNNSALEVLGSLELDGVELPVYDLAQFNAAVVDRVSSFSTNFGVWQVPEAVAQVLAIPAGTGAVLEWIHDTGELVLLGGTPQEGEVSVEVSDTEAFAAGLMPGFLGGSVAGIDHDSAGRVRELFKSEVMPEGSRVALLAHVKHGPKVHELLWGWHREHRKPEAWAWLVERLARLEGDGDTGATDSEDHLG
jgi:hypothetical protein